MTAFAAVRVALCALLATMWMAVASTPSLGAEPSGVVAPRAASPQRAFATPSATEHDARRSGKAARRKSARAAHIGENTGDDVGKSVRGFGAATLLAAAAGALAARRGREDKPPQAATPRPVFARWRQRALTAGIALLAASGLLMLYGPDWLGPLLGGDAVSHLYVAAKTVHDLIGAVFLLALTVGLLVAARTPLRWLWRVARGTSAPFGALAAWRVAFADRASFSGSAARLVAGVPAIALALLAVTGISMFFPYEIQLFRAAHDMALAVGLARPPSVTLWCDMELTTLAHATAGLILIAVLLLRWGGVPDADRAAKAPAVGPARPDAVEAVGRKGGLSSVT